LWAGAGDYTFARAVQIHLEGLLTHGVFLAAAITSLAFVSAQVAGKPDSQREFKSTSPEYSAASAASWRKASSLPYLRLAFTSYRNG
jgi:hypothetical protein